MATSRNPDLSPGLCRPLALSRCAQDSCAKNAEGLFSAQPSPSFGGSDLYLQYVLWCAQYMVYADPGSVSLTVSICPFWSGRTTQALMVSDAVSSSNCRTSSPFIASLILLKRAERPLMCTGLRPKYSYTGARAVWYLTHRVSVM